MPVSKDMKRITITVSVETDERLEAVAKKMHQRKGQLLGLLLEAATADDTTADTLWGMIRTAGKDQDGKRDDKRKSAGKKGS